MNNPVFSADHLHEIVKNIFRAGGVSDAQSEAIAENMVWSECVGRSNFGVKRIPIHLKRLKLGLLNPVANPEIKETSAGMAQIDADNAFGHFAGKIGIEKAVELAGNSGIGMVVLKRSNWYGTGAYFTKIAAEAGMISLAASNAFPKVAAFGGASAVLGTNPFAFGAPRSTGEHIMVDFATASLAGSTVRELRDSGRALDEGLAVYPDGKPLTDPADLEAGALLPFGGAKGFGVALLVEILAGVISGSGFSETVNSTYSNFDDISNSGHCLIAIDVQKLMPLDVYFARLETLVQILKTSGSQDHTVRLPGEVRWQTLSQNTKNGIRLSDASFQGLARSADEFNVEITMPT
ncbi:MAG: Ldh family oxidoreductase [Pseudomonadota bacterium]